MLKSRLHTRRQWLLQAVAPRARVRTLTAGPQHHFFGYYGVSPWNHDGDKMICLETAFQNRMPRPNETAMIVAVDPATGMTTPITETRAWNLQQGCMLNWWRPRERDTILFNDAADGEIVSVALHLAGGKRRVYDRAIEASCPAERTGGELRDLWAAGATAPGGGLRGGTGSESA